MPPLVLARAYRPNAPDNFFPRLEASTGVVSWVRPVLEHLLHAPGDNHVREYLVANVHRRVTLSPSHWHFHWETAGPDLEIASFHIVGNGYVEHVDLVRKDDPRIPGADGIINVQVHHNVAFVRRYMAHQHIHDKGICPVIHCAIEVRVQALKAHVVPELADPVPVETNDKAAGRNKRPIIQYCLSGKRVIAQTLLHAFELVVGHEIVDSAHQLLVRQNGD